jgi:hypothetical protein
MPYVIASVYPLQALLQGSPSSHARSASVALRAFWLAFLAEEASEFRQLMAGLRLGIASQS